MESTETQNRRTDDQDRRLNERLERLEKQQERTQTSVVALETTVNTVKGEQVHMREIMDARLRMIEDTGKLHTAKLEDLRSLLATMMDSADKSPAGREMLTHVRELEKACSEQERRIQELTAWKNKADGILSVAFWLGWSGLAGLALTGLRMLKVLP